MDAKNNTYKHQHQQQQQQLQQPQTTPGGKRSTAASVFKSHHVVRNADIVDVASDASLYCGGTENETETDTQHAATPQQQLQLQQQQQQQTSQPQPTPRAAPRASSCAAVNVPQAAPTPTPKPRQAVKSSKGSSSFDLLYFYSGWRVRGEGSEWGRGVRGKCSCLCMPHKDRPTMA